MDRRLVTAAGILLLTTVGCVMGPQQTTTVDWDLTQGHARSAVHWPGDRLVYEVANADATIRLPAGHTFRGRGVKLRVYREGDLIQVLQVLYPQTTIDDGYAKARALAGDWQLRTDQVDAWYREVQAGRQRGVKDTNQRFPVIMAGQPLAAGGPTPFGKVLDSFDVDRPFQLDLEFQWTQPATA